MARRWRADVLVFIQCTAPLMTVADVDGTVQALLEKEADSALAVAPFYHFVWREDEAGEAQAINHDKRVRPLRQQREPQFWEPGAVYALRVEGFLRARFRFFGKTVMHVMSAENASEIDEPLDFEMAEMVMRAREASRVEN